jgi:hypothetical protein
MQQPTFLASLTVRKFGTYKELDLPPLVVYGKQPSGKNSVLGLITGIPFPIGETKCTSFATE